MIIYRKRVFGELRKTFDESGTLLLQQFTPNGRAHEVVSINTETLDEEEINLDSPCTDNQPIDEDDIVVVSDADGVGLQFDPDLAEFGTGDQTTLKTYTVSAMVVVHQLFAPTGEPLGQRLFGHFDEASGLVEEWNGKKMVPTVIEQDDELPFPAIRLPFPYVWDAEFSQPENLSDDEMLLVRQFL